MKKQEGQSQRNWRHNSVVMWHHQSSH